VAPQVKMVPRGDFMSPSPSNYPSLSFSYHPPFTFQCINNKILLNMGPTRTECHMQPAKLTLSPGEPLFSVKIHPTSIHSMKGWVDIILQHYLGMQPTCPSLNIDDEEIMSHPKCSLSLTNLLGHRIFFLMLHGII
jgi:hypothetical protein